MEYSNSPRDYFDCESISIPMYLTYLVSPIACLLIRIVNTLLSLFGAWKITKLVFETLFSFNSIVSVILIKERVVEKSALKPYCLW